MLNRLIIFLLFIVSACSNPPEPENTSPVTKAPAKPETTTVKTKINPWTVNSFAPKEGEEAGRKYVKFVTDGEFSDSTNNRNYLYAEIFVDKMNGGIFLHEHKKSNPSQKFDTPVQIKMTNSSGEELLMTSSRRWNASGGILIERRNNDYSQFRIFMLSSKGSIAVEIKDSASKIYNFRINADGFSDSFTRI